MNDYLKKVEEWKNSKNLSLKLKEELNSLSDKELQDAFYTDLAFGTGGLRGIMGVGTNRMNSVVLQKATLGFARYLLKNEPNAKERGVVIAHDNRNNHDEFQKAVADVLTSLGIKVYVFSSLRTTPELSFTVRYLKASGGINITASHNPKEYNGYKIYNSLGNQLIVEQSNKVMQEIESIGNAVDLVFEGNDSLLITLDESVDRAYYDMVESTSLNKDMKKDNILIVYTPQHGTGYVPVTTVLKEEGYKVIEVKEQCFPNGDFINTKCPNPEDKSAYELAIKYALANNADLVISNDPDCDRIGIVLFDNDKNPVYMSGNQTGAVLIEYLLSQRKKQGILGNNGVIYNTIVSSPLGAKVASLYNVRCEQTLTGFKYIGDKIAKAKDSEFEIGYEESYGYLINKEVRDKDGVQSAMMIAEMASYYKHLGKTILDVYQEIEEKLGYYAESQISYYAKGQDGAIRISNLMNKLRNSKLLTIADEKVKIHEDYLTLTKECDGVSSPLVGFEKSNVLRYILDDGSFVAVRPSGTEPKVKFYFSLMGKTNDLALKRHDKVKEFFLSLVD